MGITGAYMAQGFLFAAVLTQVPAVQEKFQISDDLLALILLAVPITAAIGSLLAGEIAPKIGSSVLLRLAHPAVCAVIIMIGLAPTRVTLYIALAAFGMLIGAVDATMNMQGVLIEWRYRKSMLSSFYGFFSLAGIIGSLATAVTAGLHLALAPGLACVAVLGLIGSLIVGPALLRPGESRADHTAWVTAASTAAAAIPWKPIILVGIAVMLMYISDSAVSTWSAVYLHSFFDASNSVAALGVGAYMGCQVAGRFVAHRLTGRINPVPMVAIGALIGAGGMAAAASAPSAVVAIIGFGVVGFGLAPIVPLSFSVAGALDTTASGVAVARVNIFNYFGFIVGAALIGGVNAFGGWRLAFAVPAALALLIAAMAGAFRSARRA